MHKYIFFVQHETSWFLIFSITGKYFPIAKENYFWVIAKCACHLIAVRKKIRKSLRRNPKR